jgi:hypothetical protein
VNDTIKTMSENIVSSIINNIQTKNITISLQQSADLSQIEINNIQIFIEKSIKIVNTLNDLIKSDFAGSELFEFPAKDLSQQIRDQGTLNMDLDFLFDEDLWNQLINYLGDSPIRMTNPDFGERTYVKNAENFLNSFIFNDGEHEKYNLTKISKSKLIGDLWQKMLFKVTVWISTGKQDSFSQIVLPIYFIKYLQLFNDMGTKTNITFAPIIGDQFERNSSNIISQSFFAKTTTSDNLEIKDFDSPIDATTKILYSYLLPRVNEIEFIDEPTRYLFSSLSFFVPWASFKELNHPFTLINSLKQIIPFYHHDGTFVPSLLISKKVIPEKFLTLPFEKLLSNPLLLDHIAKIVVFDQANNLDQTKYLDFINSQMPKPRYHNDMSEHLFEVYKYEIYLIHEYYYDMELFKQNHHTFQNLPFTVSIYPSVWSENALYKDWYFGIPPKTILPGAWPRRSHQETLDDLPPYYLRPNAKLLEQFRSDLSASFIMLPDSIMLRDEQFWTLGIDTDRTFFILKDTLPGDLFSDLKNSVALLGPGVTKEHVTAAFFWENLVRRRSETDPIPVNETVDKIPQNSNLGIWVSEMKRVKPRIRDNLVLLYDRLIAQLMAMAYYQFHLPKNRVIEEGKKTFVSDFVTNVFERELDRDNEAAKPWLNGIFTNLSLAALIPQSAPLPTVTSLPLLPPIPQPPQISQHPQIQSTIIQPQTLTSFLALPPIPQPPPTVQIPQTQSQILQPQPQLPQSAILIPVSTISSYSEGGRRRRSSRRRRSNPRRASSFFRRVRKPKRRSRKSPKRKSSSRHRR